MQDHIANDIALLLNKHNRLKEQHSIPTIKDSQVKYLVVMSPKKDKVIGCIGILYNDVLSTKICHLSVDSDFRRKGIGRRLLATALSRCSTELTHIDVREDNKECLELVSSFGFFRTYVENKEGYQLVHLSRRNKENASSTRT